MKIKTFDVETQEAKCGTHVWSVARLIELSKDLPVMEVNINHLNVYSRYNLTLREMVMHINAVLKADLSYPIILDEDGEILDGRHRIMKAIIEGKETVLARRFEENPTPCKIVDKD